MGGQVTEWEIPEQAIQVARLEMAIDGNVGNEGTVLWLGRRRDQSIVSVSHVVCLRGPGIAKAPDYLRISADLLNDVTDAAIELGVYLVAQIHSHGPGYGTDLSRVDHSCGVRAPWFLSLVAPNYSLSPFLDIPSCGVHVFVPDRGFVRMRKVEVFRRVLVTGNDAQRLEIGA